MKKLILSSLLLFGFSTPSFAGIAIGTDVIRILDQNSVNVIIQNSISRSTALMFDVALNEQNYFEFGLKSYSGRMYSGVYYQAGVGLHDAGEGNEIGVTAKIGYEKSPARNFVFFGTVQGEYLISTGDIVYSPKLGAMFAF